MEALLSRLFLELDVDGMEMQVRSGRRWRSGGVDVSVWRQNSCASVHEAHPRELERGSSRNTDLSSEDHCSSPLVMNIGTLETIVSSNTIADASHG